MIKKELCQSMLAKRNGTYRRTPGHCGAADTVSFRSDVRTDHVSGIGLQ